MAFRIPPLYPILDSFFFPAEPDARETWLRAAIAELGEGGVTLVQLRAKGLTREQTLRDAAVIRDAAQGAMTLLLNDTVDLVPVAGFDGVHLGQDDMPLEAARQALGAGAVLGLSTHNADQMRDADRSSANYIACGPVFATTTKLDTEPVIGLAGVSAARALTTKPLVAIGGISLERAPEVWRAGADSVAVIGALFAGPRRPGAIARDFLRLFR